MIAQKGKYCLLKKWEKQKKVMKNDGKQRFTGNTKGKRTL